jgi:inhibitor of cysteine peptidase
MKSKIILIIVISATVLTLLACGSSSTPKQVSVDSSYSGKEVEIATDGSLTVTLESNSSTGFKWELTNISDQAVLEKTDQKYIAPEAPQNGVPLVGAPGKEVWTFNALQKGSSTISMEYRRPQNISVDSSYAGKEVEIGVGSSLIVTLESNRTTGFQWDLASITDQTVIEKTDQQYIAPEATQNEPPLVGAPGKEVWIFDALKKGNGTITLEYRRPWEQGVEPAKTFTLTVSVNEEQGTAPAKTFTLTVSVK